MPKSIANELSPEVLARVALLVRLLEKEGLSYDAYQVPIDDPAKRRLLVRYWQAGMPDFESDGIPALETVATPVQSAGYVHDIRAVNELLSLGYDEGALQGSGPPLDALPGYLTFFDPGWNLLRLWKFCNGKGIFYKRDWYGHKAFAKKSEGPRYRRLRLKPGDGSFNKTFEEQRRLLPDTEEVPLARVVAVGMVLHYLATRFRPHTVLFPVSLSSCPVRLFDRYIVRCADKTSDGARVFIGNFGSSGIDLGGYWDDYRFDDLGLAASRKS